MTVDLSQELDRREAEMAAAFAAVVSAIRNEHTLDRLGDLLRTGRFREALDAALQHVSRLGDSWANAYVATGQHVAGQISSETDRNVSFNIVSPRSVFAMQQARLRLIQLFTQEQIAATRQALSRSIRRGLSDEELVRAFQDSLGLTRRQEMALANYRRMLETGDRNALRRSLRDRSQDEIIERALRENRALSAATIARLVDRYRQRALAHRASIVGQVEGLQATHAANDEAFRQAVDAGVLAEDQIEQTWTTRGDERVRGSHVAMHGQTRPRDVPFNSGLGNELMFPGDPSAPAEDVMECRCYLQTAIHAPVGAGSTLEENL